MASRRHTLLLTVAMAVVLALVLGLAWFSTRGGGAEVDAVPVGQIDTRPKTSGEISRPPQSDGGSRLSEIPAPSLSVVVVGPGGLPLSLAEIVATGPAGVRQATGRARWNDAEIGEWAIEITHEGYLPARERLTLVDGLEAELVVTMHDSVDVHGRVVDILGTPLPRTPVNFTLEGATTTTAQRGKATAGAMTDNQGEFEVQLAASGDYRLAIGSTRRPRLVAPEPVALSPGRHEVDIVTPGASGVSVLVDDLPSDALKEEGVVQARLYVHSAAKDPGSGAGPRREGRRLPDPSALPRRSDTADDKAEREGMRRLGTGKSENRKSPPAAQEGESNGERRGGGQGMGSDWVHKVSQPLGTDGTAFFRGLDPEREYRLVLEYRRVRFQATRGFRLDPSRSTNLRTALPPLPLGPDGKRLRGVAEPMEVWVEYRSSGDDAQEIGFHWKE